MARCLISFGANIGDAWATIQTAAARLQQLLCGDEPNAGEPAFRLSRPFRTPPVGGPAGQPPFINAVAALTTQASPWEVWNCIRSAEKEFGRERNLRWEARRIDLDILLYDQQRIWTPHLKIPHPRMCMRRFILLPAVDVAQDWLDPVSGWTIGQLADSVRLGPSNLILIADQASKPESLLAEAARRTGATWQPLAPSGELAVAGIPPGRWVSALATPLSQIAASELGKIVDGLPKTKLIIVLAPQTRGADAAWEDYHHSLACALGLHALSPTLDAASDAAFSCSSPCRLLGPRYLLASDDRNWAVQELIAALEAMDCPIEAT